MCENPLPLQIQTHYLNSGLSIHWSVIALPVSAPPNTNIIAPATLPVIYRLKD